MRTRRPRSAPRHPIGSFIATLALLSAAACSSPEDTVVQTWNEYHRAMGASDVTTVRSLLAAGRADELAGPDAATALELRSAMVPADPVVSGVEVSALRALVRVEGLVEGQNVSGVISFTKESKAWKVFEEEWTVNLTAAFPASGVILAEAYSAGPEASPQVWTEISAHDGDVTELAFTRDGRHLVSIGYNDKRLRLWDPASGDLLDDRETEHRPSDLAMHPDGSAAYVVDAYGHLTEWPIEWGVFGAPMKMAGMAGRNPRIAVDATGRRAVTTSWDDPAKLWDLEERAYVRALPQSGKMRGVAFSPAGPVVACGNYGDYFAVWDLDRLSWPVGARKKHRVRKAGSESDVWSVAFSPDGRRLATGHMDTSMSVWDLARGKEIHNWYVPNCSVRDVEFSPCGTVLATAQADGKVHLWDPETRGVFFRLQAHEESALSIAFNPADGVTMATGGEDGAIRIWQ